MKTQPRDALSRKFVRLLPFCLEFTNVSCIGACTGTFIVRVFAMSAIPSPSDNFIVFLFDNDGHAENRKIRNDEMKNRRIGEIICTINRMFNSLFFLNLCLTDSRVALANHDITLTISCFPPNAFRQSPQPGS